MQWQHPLKTYGPIPSPRRGHTMTRLLNSSTLVVFAGESENDVLLNDMYTFDITTATWHRVTYASEPVPHARYRHTATAISSTAIVVIGGDDHVTSTDAAASSATPIDAWLFDLRTSTWACLSKDESYAPATRGGHSAVFIKVPGQPPGIYVFGGFGAHNFSAVVYRLRTTDWKWERVNIMVETPQDGAIQVTDPYQELVQMAYPERASASCPCPRESHISLWVPNLNGMLVFGGESDDIFHNDFWLLTPAESKSRAWRWHQLKVRMAGNFPDNIVPSLAAASGVLLPTECPKLLIWAGMTSPNSLNLLRHAWVIDLIALQSVLVNVHGLPIDTGRVLHALIRTEDRLLVCGGVDAESDLPCDIQVVKLTKVLRTSCERAADFGPVAARIARGEFSPDENGAKDDDTMEKRSLAPSPSRIPMGATFSGKVTLSTQFGTHVSVVINGRVYKGLLITYPLTQDKKLENIAKDIVTQAEKGDEETLTRNAKSGDNETTKGESTVTQGGLAQKSSSGHKAESNKGNGTAEALSSERLAKKRKFEAMVAALPDVDGSEERPLQAPTPEVIDLD